MKSSRVDLPTRVPPKMIARSPGFGIIWRSETGAGRLGCGVVVVVKDTAQYLSDLLQAGSQYLLGHFGYVVAHVRDEPGDDPHELSNPTVGALLGVLVLEVLGPSGQHVQQSVSGRGCLSQPLQGRFRVLGLATKAVLRRHH